MPKMPPPPSRMPSTSGPAVSARVSSKTAANRTGVSSIAHRLRINHPPRAPTARLAAMAVRACRVVIGPRGVHQPASRPHPAATITAAAMPARRSRRGCARGVSVGWAGRGGLRMLMAGSCLRGDMARSNVGSRVIQQHLRWPR